MHRFAIATALGAYALFVLGGLVHGTDSREACPDWPLCHGQALPRMVGGVAIEHGHRLVAGLVGLMTVGLAGWMTFVRPRAGRLVATTWLAAGLVLAQVLLGALGVLLPLPRSASAAHTALSLLFFGTLLVIALRSRPTSLDWAPVDASARRLALVAAIAVFAQGAMGGLVRHSGAALACPDFPLCRGSLWPAAYVTAHVHVLHRMGSVLVAVLVLASSVANFRAARGRPLLRLLALAAPVLVVLQMYLGVRSVRSFLHLPTVEGHLAVGLALLGAQWAVYVAGAPTKAGAEGLRGAAAGLVALGRDLVALTKPRISFLVVVTFLGGMWMAPGTVDGWHAFATLLGTVLIVGAANALNMYLERDVDGLMQRTRNRPLPQGRIGAEIALGLGTTLACASVPLLVLGGNGLTAVLGLAAFFLYVFAYTPLKRRSPLALYVGAVPGALPPLMGWTAATGTIDAGGLALFGILFFWQVPHFLAIAAYRSEEYERAGLRVYSLDRQPIATKLGVVLGTIALVVVAALPTLLGVTGPTYLVASLLLGAAFLRAAFQGLGGAHRARWAKRLFLTSLVYLTLLFIALAADRLIERVTSGPTLI